MSPRIHETHFRVRYAETDQMGIVYYANYLIWMEIGRVEYCRSLGIEYREMERQDGILLTVVESNCRYHAPALYDDEITVKTWLEQSRPRMATFAYEMTCAAKSQKLATGFTKHIFCNRELKPTRLPSKYWPYFEIPTPASGSSSV